MTYDFANDLLNDLAALGMISDPMVEPIDDPSYNVDFLDYADVVGIDIDDYVPAEYDHA
jgi:hypothetical protein